MSVLLEGLLTKRRNFDEVIFASCSSSVTPDAFTVPQAVKEENREK